MSLAVYFTKIGIDLGVHPLAIVAADVLLSSDVTVWQGTSIREGARVGSGTSIGQYAYVGPGVTIGTNCKIQNGAYLYEPCSIADAVFVGPRVVFTNDRVPRAVKPDGQPKSALDWEPVGVLVKHGASIGAGAVCVAPIVVGEWAMVAAGAVVTHDVPDFALVAGVPARRIGWVGPAGVPLVKIGDYWRCEKTGSIFDEISVDVIAPRSAGKPGRAG